MLKDLTYIVNWPIARKYVANLLTPLAQRPEVSLVFKTPLLTVLSTVDALEVLQKKSHSRRESIGQSEEIAGTV